MIQLADIVIDMDVYPRGEWNPATVARYAEAMEVGDRFPPVTLESGTRRLLDGMHRYQAHLKLSRDTIDAEYHEIPDGVPPLLYAASLSARHGDRISGKDLQAIARRVVTENPDFSMVKAAKLLGVHRVTISNWTSDITDRRKTVRKVRALILNRLGLSNPQIAQHLGVTHPTVAADLKEMSDLTSLSEDILREALGGLPEECAAIAEELREERIFATWTDDERNLLKRLRDGETIVINIRAEAHPNLRQWAEDADLYVRIDRRTDWGNPFETPADGDRQTVIANYARHYLPHKPSLHARLDELHGKALGCWCAPEPCHGDILKAQAEQ